MEDAKLIVVGGDTKFKVVELQFPAIIGRSKDCDIILSHSLVSRRHCEISSAGSCLKVRDLGSLNGTYVGRERITDCELRPGELLTIGTVTFRAVYGNWTEDEADAFFDVDNRSQDTARLSSDQTALIKDDNRNANDGAAFVVKAGDRVGA